MITSEKVVTLLEVVMTLRSINSPGKREKCNSCSNWLAISFIFDAKTLQLIKSVEMPEEVKEGWGFATRTYKDGSQEIYMTDGSSNIYVADEDLKVKKTL